MIHLKINKVAILGSLLVMIYIQSCQPRLKSADENFKERKMEMNSDQTKNGKKLENKLTPEQYYVLFEKGTERPFSGKYWNFDGDGYFNCAACGAKLFDSNTKFDAGCGWPSFNDVLSNENIITKDDYSFNMHRVEVMCANCGGHLGHLFDDGPKPTGLRYCINSASIDFEQRK